MVLVVRHRIAYYKRFELDIWGILKTTPILRARVPYKTKYKRVSSVKYNALKRFVYSKRTVYRISNKQTRIRNFYSLPWVFSSSKIKSIMRFFFNIFREREQRRVQTFRRYVYRIDIVKPRIFRRKLKYNFASIRLTKLFYLTLTYRHFRRIAFEMRRRDGLYGHNFCLAIEGRLMCAIYRTSLVPNLFYSVQLIKKGGVLVNLVEQSNINYVVSIAKLISFDGFTKRLLYFSLLKRLACKAIMFNVPRYMFVSYVFLFAYMKRPPMDTDLVFPVGVDIYRATGYAY